MAPKLTKLAKFIRAKTRDAAIPFRMATGYAGTVNRTHPASIVPGLINGTNPVKAYGFPVLYNAADNTVRGVLGTDGAVTKIAGVSVRPYPTQQQQTTNFGAANFGEATPPTSGIIDVLEGGFALVKVGSGTPAKGSAVFVWIAADSGNNKQGGFCAAASGGSTIAITNAVWNGPAGPDGVAELKVFSA